MDLKFAGQSFFVCGLIAANPPPCSVLPPASSFLLSSSSFLLHTHQGHNPTFFSLLSEREGPRNHGLITLFIPNQDLRQSSVFTPSPHAAAITPFVVPSVLLQTALIGCRFSSLDPFAAAAAAAAAEGSSSACLWLLKRKAE